MISRGWAIDFRWKVLASLMVKHLAGWWCDCTIPPWKNRCHVWSPSVTTEANLAFSGAKTYSNNTAEMTAMIEALSFLGPHGPVARDEQSCIYYDYPTCCWSLLGHDPGSYTCAAGTRMSTVHDMRSTQTSAHHAARVRSQWKSG